jgi:hypothetical protein
VAVWDDKTVDQMWSGEFTISGVGTLLSNKTDWVYYKTSISNPVTSSPYNSGDVTDAAVAAEIAAASWAAPLVSKTQGSSPWGTIPDFTNSPEFVWHNNFGKPNSDDGFVILYRTEQSIVPLPSTVLLLGAGLLNLARKRFFKNN